MWLGACPLHVYIRCSKLERDVKQKRLLIEEYRRKQVTVNDVLSAKDADIVSAYLIYPASTLCSHVV